METTNKMTSKISITIKLFFAFFAPFMILVFIIMAGFWAQEKKIKKERLLIQEQKNVELMQRTAVYDLKSIFMDLTYLAALPPLHQMIEQDSQENQQKVSDIFLSFSKSRALYDQIRFLDENGMEIIRVNFSNNRSVIVPVEQLQNKAKRYYFADTIRLEPGQIFVSPLDLNIEHGEVEQPLKPMIRFGTPIVNLKGQKQGIVLLNYFGAKMIQDIEKVSTETVGQLMLLNSEGYWLKGLDSKDEWGFMFKEHNEKTLAATDLQAWEIIKSQKSGQIINKQGLYTFSTTHPIAYGMSSSTGSEDPFTSSKKTYSHNGYYWKIVSFIPDKELSEQVAGIQQRWIIIYLLISILSGFVSWLLSSNIVRRKRVETKRLSIETALQKSEKQYRMLFENMTDVFYRLDQNGIILEVSPSALKLYNYDSIDEIIGKHVNDFVYNIEDSRIFNEELQKKKHLINYVIKHKQKNGTPLFVETNAKAVFDMTGQIEGTVGIFRDITERVQAEEKLKDSEYKYRTLFHDLADPIFIFMDKEPNTFLDCNKTAIEKYGYSREELLKMTPLDLHSFDALDRVMNNIQNEDFLPHEYIHMGKDGKKYFVNIHTSKIKYKGEDAQISLVRDITEHKQGEAEKKKFHTQLRQAQKMESIGTLAGGIAHDFNNILFPIIGHTEMLIEDIPETSPFQDGLNEIYTGALRARELVRQILTFSSQGTNELLLMKMQPIIKEALKLIRSTIPATIEIKQYIQSKCRVIKADPTQIHQIIMNLATNAYHAMEETGGILKVNLKEVEFGEFDLIKPGMTPGVYACLIITDTGIGMNKDLTEKIFDPFFTTKATGKGTGMGLSVVHGIVKGMGGTIQVYSEPGKGSEFKVYFPVEKGCLKKQEIKAHEAIHGGTEHILFLDDEEIIIHMGKQMMERLGYRVTSRTSSIEALEAFRDNPHKFDLVITDMAMPNMAGDKLAVELIKIRPDIPILLCTGFSETMSEEQANFLGIKGFLLKPVVMKDLAQKIREVLDEKN